MVFMRFSFSRRPARPESLDKAPAEAADEANSPEKKNTRNRR